MGNHFKPHIGSQHREIITRHAQSFSLDPALVEAVILTESSGNPHAISRKGAVGLMQVMPSTARQLTKELRLGEEEILKLSQPDFNVRLGCYYLYSLMRKLKGDVVLVLAAYNTGPYRVQKWLKDHDNLSSWEIVCRNGSKETRGFVVRVLYYYGKLDLLYEKHE